MTVIENENFILNNTAVTLGNFDGFHMGHRALVSEVVASGLTSVIFTFSPHPLSLFHPEKSFKTIYTEAEKRAVAETLSADFFVSYPFTRDFAALSPEAFIDLLCKKTGCRLLVTGENYSFGKNKAGNAQTLKKLGVKYGIEVRIVPRVTQDGKPVSSTRIREYIASGDIEKANALLSSEFFIKGTVVGGKHIGSVMGFPTANLSVDEGKLLPSDGVYATIAEAGGRSNMSVTNIGKNPTFHAKNRTIETHILDWDKNLYNSHITVRFISKIRDEQKFSSKNELVSQIEKDIERARELLLKGQ